MEREAPRRYPVLAVCGWLVLALFVAPFASAVERGVVLVQPARGEQAKSATARTALVIGNGSYRRGPLRNPVNDAADVAEALQGLGFEVVLALDVTEPVFKEGVRKFHERLQRRGGVGLFYYAGHGIQVRGRNYLIPVGADIEKEVDVEYEAVDAGWVLGYMDAAKPRLNIVILDACRDNPYERSWRSTSQGLKRLELPQGPLGSLLAYSTAPGKVAADGIGRNSPFTKHLLLNLGIADLDIEDVFKRTRIGVSQETSGQQIPWSESSLLGDFYFRRSTLADRQRPIAEPQPSRRTLEKARLTVSSSVTGATVYIDGDARGPSGPTTHELDSGTYKVRVEKPGYRPWERRVVLSAGDRRTMHAQLSPIVSELPTQVRPLDSGSHQASLSHNTAFRDTLRDGSQGPQMEVIKGGCFQMGSPLSETGRRENERQHKVCVSDFAMGKYEVTFAEYDHYADSVRRENTPRPPSRPRDAGWGRGTLPVVNVKGWEARDYASWLSKQTGKRYRIPTEAEWEYAARGGTTTAYWWGDAVGQNNANCKGCGSRWDNRQTSPVGSFSPNPNGLYDTAGNVWEWTCTGYHGQYDNAEKRCNSPREPLLVIRGGSWLNEPVRLRSASRGKANHAMDEPFIGFRLARDL